MLMEVGHVEAIFQYPVKSLAGEQLEAAELGWHGLDGDRRLAFPRVDDRDDAPAITVTMRDVRCSMVNLDPDSATPAPEMLKAAVRAHQNTAGVYAAISRMGDCRSDKPCFSDAALGG